LLPNWLGVVPIGVELLDPVIAYVANLDMAGKVESQAYGIVELP
jgi:hypothetical protein